VTCISTGSGSTPCHSVLLRKWGLAAAERVFWRSGSSCVRVNYADRVPSLTLAARELCLTIPSECNAAMSSHRTDNEKFVEEIRAAVDPDADWQQQIRQAVEAYMSSPSRRARQSA